MKTKEELNKLSGIIIDSAIEVHRDMKLSGKSLGLLINFHVPLLKDGIKRHVINFPQ